MINENEHVANETCFCSHTPEHKISEHNELYIKKLQEDAVNRQFKIAILEAEKLQNMMKNTYNDSIWEQEKANPDLPMRDFIKNAPYSPEPFEVKPWNSMSYNDLFNDYSYRKEKLMVGVKMIRRTVRRDVDSLIPNFNSTDVKLRKSTDLE